uniref:Uncharacterized protein n=1 Tax=Oryzias melastigma TaxID=30732 RepID=A0A3B3BST5_ORYME
MAACLPWGRVCHGGVSAMASCLVSVTQTLKLLLLPPDLKYILIGGGIGLFLAAVFLATKICMIQRHILDIFPSPGPGFLHRQEGPPTVPVWSRSPSANDGDPGLSHAW